MCSTILPSPNHCEKESSLSGQFMFWPPHSFHGRRKLSRRLRQEKNIYFFMLMETNVHSKIKKAGLELLLWLVLWLWRKQSLHIVLIQRKPAAHSICRDSAKGLGSLVCPFEDQLLLLCWWKVWGSASRKLRFTPQKMEGGVQRHVSTPYVGGIKRKGQCWL